MPKFNGTLRFAEIPRKGDLGVIHISTDLSTEPEKRDFFFHENIYLMEWLVATQKSVSVNGEAARARACGLPDLIPYTLN